MPYNTDLGHAEAIIRAAIEGRLQKTPELMERLKVVESEFISPTWSCDARVGAFDVSIWRELGVGFRAEIKFRNDSFELHVSGRGAKIRALAIQYTPVLKLHDDLQEVINMLPVLVETYRKATQVDNSPVVGD